MKTPAIQVNKGQWVSPAHITLIDELKEGNTYAAALTLTTGQIVYCSPDYWPAAKDKILYTPRQQEDDELLDSLDYLDSFKTQLGNVQINDRVLPLAQDVPLSVVILTLARALKEEGFKAYGYKHK